MKKKWRSTRTDYPIDAATRTATLRVSRAALQKMIPDLSYLSQCLAISVCVSRSVCLHCLSWCTSSVARVHVPCVFFSETVKEPKKKMRRYNTLDLKKELTFGIRNVRVCLCDKRCSFVSIWFSISLRVFTTRFLNGGRQRCQHSAARRGRRRSKHNKRRRMKEREKDVGDWATDVLKQKNKEKNRRNN